MGYNSWYDLYMTPSEQAIRDTVSALKETGLFAAGYHYVNLDDGMVSYRDDQGVLHPDPKYFPSGFKVIADFLHQNGMKFGVYTDRGNFTCGGRPAAGGHETIDAQTYASWGVDYVKEDSCNATQDHLTAYREYSLMRDGLNATGRPIFFSLCGWNNWYAPVGRLLGNSWRIGPDDTNWNGVLTNIDINADLWPYAGPGGWNDPCLLLGRDNEGREAVTDLQGRAQFTMWAVMSSPLLLSQNVRNLTKMQLETYLNEEVIAVSQDPLGRQGQKLMGGDLAISGPGDADLTLQTCAKSMNQQWEWNVTAPLFILNPASKYCANVDDCGTQLIAYPCVTTGGTCAGPNSYANEQFTLLSDGTIRSKLNGYCVTHNGIGYSTKISPCNGSKNQMWSYENNQISSLNGQGCLTIGGDSGPRVNIWGRPLDDGSWAIAFINADMTAASLTCDATCLSVTGWDANQILKVRDLWAHQDLPNTTVNQGLSVNQLEANGGIAFYKLTPIYN